MGERRVASWVLRVLLRLALAAGVVVAIGYLSVLGLHGTKHSTAVRIEDTNNLRHLVLPAVASGKLPLKDGAFDPYKFARNGEIVRASFGLFRSKRSGIGPTDEEIERGDYTNFPWERYRGDGKLDGPAFPLLWEAKPDEEGKVLVALSDGSVTYAEPR